jgi:hypothetical protein
VLKFSQNFSFVVIFGKYSDDWKITSVWHFKRSTQKNECKEHSKFTTRNYQYGNTFTPAPVMPISHRTSALSTVVI